MKITWKTVVQTIFTIILTILGIVFFSRNAGEMRTILQTLDDAKPIYLLFALVATAAGVILQAQCMYLAYRSIEKEIPLQKLIALYLKRFFLSPFVPGGFSVAQYTLSKDLDDYDVSGAEHAYASSAYVLSSMSSYFIILVPAVLLAGRAFRGVESRLFLTAQIIVMVILVAALIAYLARKPLLEKVRAILKPYIGHFHIAPIIEAVGTSIFVDISGILTLWFSLHAVGIHHKSIGLAAIAYVITILVVTLSPLFQGLVVVEGVLVLLLTQASISSADALGAVLIFRLFQMWLPVLVGGIVYALPIWHHARRHLTGNDS